MRAVVIGLAVAVLAFWCGKGGDVEEESTPLQLEPRDAVFGEVSNTLVVSIIDKTGACSAVQARSMLRNTTSLTIVIPEPKSGMLQPGKYQVWQPMMGIPSNVAIVDLTKTDDTCGNTLSTLEATPLGGSVTIESIDLVGGKLTGSYDLRFGAGAFSGSFVASQCELPEDLDALDRSATLCQ